MPFLWFHDVHSIPQCICSSSLLDLKERVLLPCHACYCYIIRKDRWDGMVMMMMIIRTDRGLWFLIWWYALDPLDALEYSGETTDDDTSWHRNWCGAALKERVKSKQVKLNILSSSPFQSSLVLLYFVTGTYKYLTFEALGGQCGYSGWLLVSTFRVCLCCCCRLYFFVFVNRQLKLRTCDYWGLLRLECERWRRREEGKKGTRKN